MTRIVTVRVTDHITAQGYLVETMWRCMGAFHQHDYRCPVCDKELFGTVRVGESSTATGEIIMRVLA